MQWVSSGSLSSGPVSVAIEPSPCSSSSFCNYDRISYTRVYRVSPFPGFVFQALELGVRPRRLHRSRKLHKAGVAVEVSEERFAGYNSAKSQLTSTVATDPDKRAVLSSERRVYDVILRQAALIDKATQSRPLASDLSLNSIPVATMNLLNEAYNRCGEVCAEYAKTFYLGTLLMTLERRKAVWAIYVWCRRTDELVDGPNSSQITATVLDRWERRLEKIFEGQPYDMLDAALSHTVLKFPVDIQPFRDMINGMRMDLVKTRYFNFDELYLYCYYVAGTVGLMTVSVMGIDPESKASTESVYNAALALGIANQLTNILRDIGEDARRGRIYVPQDELEHFGLSDDDIFAGIVTDKWRAFMKNQIKRARFFFKQAEKGIPELDKDSRWPVWTSLLLYEQILDSIEANDYDNFTRRAHVGKLKKLITLPVAYVRAAVPPPSVTRLAVAG